ncbi:MAG: Icc protein [Phycisphaerales bacterium]|jgi:Icc protein
MTPPTDLSRRDALRAISVGGLGAAALSAGASGGGAGGGEPDGRRRVLRVAHLTDMHIDGERGSDRALAACYAHAQEHGAELILNTGDTVMELNGASRTGAERQWGVFQRVTKAECGLEMVSAIGNHDCWGWESGGSAEPGRGKQMVRQELALPGRYYRVDRAGWSFVVLDSIWSGEGGGYAGRLDGEQLEWLREELAKIGPETPTVVMTHIPIITACGFFDGERFGERCGERGWTIPGSWMHEDARALKDLFIKHPNVKLALSGHMHQLDRVDFAGVSYVCSGAVSGNWWKGQYYGCDYGYSMIDLFDDGSFEQSYHGYGWDGEGAG